MLSNTGASKLYYSSREVIVNVFIFLFFNLTNNFQKVRVKSPGREQKKKIKNILYAYNVFASDMFYCTQDPGQGARGHTSFRNFGVLHYRVGN